MHVAVLASAESWYLSDLRRAAGATHRITAVSFRQLASSIGGDTTVVSADGFDLSRTDAVLVRTMPPGSLEQIVFRMDVLGRLEAAGTPVFNPPRSLEVAVDKYLALSRLQEAGLLVPPTEVCQTVDDAMAAFDTLGGDVVLKPLFGSEGRGMTRLTDEAIALRAFQALVPLGAVLYLQRFVDHFDHDLRLLVVGDEVFGMRRENAADWRTNVARGATTEPFEPTDAMVAVARTAARAVGASLAGVDLLPGRDGRCYVLEVNAVPGWKALSATLSRDIAAVVLAHVANAVACADSAAKPGRPVVANRTPA